MSQEIISREDITIGMSVEINPQSDRTRNIIVSGIVEEILTKSYSHPHGILVKLKDGETGRVKKILSHSTDFSCKIIQDVLIEQPTVSDESRLNDLLINGENHYVEFKSSALWSIRLTDEQINANTASADMKKYRQNTSKFVIARTIAGFLNSDGGSLIIGVKENKSILKDEIIGIESEFFKLKDQCIDGYRRMLTDQIIKLYFPLCIFHHLNDYIHIKFLIINDKTLCWIQIKKSDINVFVSYNKIEHFFVRIDASTRELNGSEIVNYCMKHFS